MDPFMKVALGTLFLAVLVVLIRSMRKPKPTDFPGPPYRPPFSRRAKYPGKGHYDDREPIQKGARKSGRPFKFPYETFSTV